VAALQGDTWARVSSVHGQTLLSLAFNYGILSLKTLTFGTDVLSVAVEDRPLGCMLDLNEREKVGTVLRLLMRDFKTEPRSPNRTRAQVSRPPTLYIVEALRGGFCRPTQCYGDVAVCVALCVYCAQTTESIVMRPSHSSLTIPNMNPIVRGDRHD